MPITLFFRLTYNPKMSSPLISAETARVGRGDASLNGSGFHRHFRLVQGDSCMRASLLKYFERTVHIVLANRCDERNGGFLNGRRCNRDSHIGAGGDFKSFTVRHQLFFGSRMRTTLFRRESNGCTRGDCSTHKEST